MMDENEINHIVAMYKKKREREYNNYHTKYKYDEDMVNSRRERSKLYYKNNADIKKQLYQENKDFHRARSSYYYYLKNKKLQVFHEKYKDRVKLLEERGFKVDPPIQLPVVVRFD
jgi:hypothetical protein